MGENEGSENKTKSVRVPLTESTFEEWTQAAAEENKKKTELVREAVNLYISDNWVLEKHAENDVDTSNIETRLETIEERLDELTLNPSNDEPAPDIDRAELLSLADDVREILPNVASEDDFISQLSVGMISRPCHLDHISTVLGTPTEKTRSVLIYANRHQDIQTTTVRGERAWFRVIEDDRDGSDSSSEPDVDAVEDETRASEPPDTTQNTVENTDTSNRPETRPSEIIPDDFNIDTETDI